ncbi:MAG TPA: hypothetical protein VHE80_01965, partial [Acidimicrobiales bacterium]|nr:hypothetical protein [Acidimicrobiales bacterium]
MPELAAGTGGVTTWRDLLNVATARLRSAAEARRMVERASGYEAAEYYSVLDETVGDRPRAHFEAMLDRRASGEPLQYVLGEWAFRT